MVGRDGCIYGIPSNSDAVLKVDPFKQEVTTLPFKYTCHHRFDGKYKYLGGVLGPDGCVYAIPVSAPAVLRIDPTTRAVSTVGREVSGAGLEKWEGGVVHDGAMYCVPQAAARVLKLDPGPPRDAQRANRP